MKPLELFLLFAFYLNIINASNNNGPIGARSSALANASSTLFDTWSTRNNQGSLAFVRKIEIGVFYGNSFLIKELSYNGFAITLPIKKGTFGFLYSSFGYQLYCESHTNLAYSLKLNKNFGVGISIDYLNTKIADLYGHANTITGSVGLTAKLTEQLLFSSHIYNPFKTKITNYNNEKIPTIFKLGAQYIISKKASILIEAEKTSGLKINIKSGIEYCPTSLIYLRVGAASYPTQASFGFGINYHNLKIDLSSMYHNILGISPQIGLSYSFGKEKNKLPENTKTEEK